jgi:hypothetical protein
MRSKIHRLDATRQERPATGRRGGLPDGAFQRLVAEHKRMRVDDDADPLAAMIASQRHEPRVVALAADVRRESHTSAPLTARL